VSHKPGGRLPLLPARPAVTPATLKRAATNFAVSAEYFSRGTMGVNAASAGWQGTLAYLSDAQTDPPTDTHPTIGGGAVE